MKLTEKELNEFPIGTKIYNDDIVYLVKIRHNAFSNDEHEYTNYGIMGFNVFKVEIPTYTEYIPPKPPILDDKEKEYLSAVIRPWRKKVKFIKKGGNKTKEYINIQPDEILGVMLPYFKAGTMYKGMKLDREYTLEELRIMR